MKSISVSNDVQIISNTGDSKRYIETQVEHLELITLHSMVHLRVI